MAFHKFNACIFAVVLLLYIVISKLHFTIKLLIANFYPSLNILKKCHVLRCDLNGNLNLCNITGDSSLVKAKQLFGSCTVNNFLS